MCGVWCVVCGVGYVVCSMWWVVYGVWCVVYGVWYVVCGVGFMVCGVRCENHSPAGHSIQDEVAVAFWNIPGGHCSGSPVPMGQ